MDHITVTSQREFQDYENLPVGEFLKNIRENQGIDIEKVSKFLKVRIKDINYLENNEIDKIEKNIYVVGLIKSYGNYLKINEKIIESRIQDLGLKSNTENKRHTLINIGKNRDLSPANDLLFNAIIATMVIIIFSLVMINIFNTQRNIITSETIINDIQKINN